MSGIGVSESVGGAVHSSSETVGIGRRRRFSSEYKRRILAEAARASHGEIGLLLRREGLYSSQLSKWRNTMTAKKQSPGLSRELKTENQRLQQENARLKLKLRKAEAMLDLQKKAAEILSYEEETVESVDNERSDS